ncbi:MAG: DUF2800 domain-containing protein [Planctomycetota bacterium]
MLKLNPSGANRWVPCPGSVQMEAPFPRSETHPITEEGKAIHWAAEQVLISWSPRNDFPAIELRNLLGAKCPENGLIITDEFVEHATTYLEAVWRYVHTDLHAMLWEHKLSAFQWVQELSGRADLTWQSPDVTYAVVADGKFGYRPVSAFENWQLVIYGMGMLRPETQTIDLVIVQPRGRAIGNPVKVWRLDREQLLAYADRVVEAAALARGPNPPLRAGGHCYKCKAAAHCPALQAAGFAAMDASATATTVEIDERQIAWELQLLRRAKEQLTAREDALEGLAIARIRAGSPVPGYAERRSLSNRSWTHGSPEETIAFGLLSGVDLATPAKPVTPQQAEVRGVPREMIDLFTERREGAAKLVCIDPDEARKVFRNG